MNASLDMSELETRLKTLWGARTMPFGVGSKEPYRSSGIQKLMGQLQQLLQVRANGVLHGPNGVGKTLLIDLIAESLPEKLFSIIRLSHTSLTGADLIRSLCLAMAVPPQMRRSDNVHLIHSHWKQMSSLHPLLIVDESQNLNAAALEELRLLSCGPRDRHSSAAFSLLLVGDEDLLPRLQMGVHRPLRSRLGFCLGLPAFSQQETQAYLICRWKEVGVNSCPIEEAAQLLIHQASAGMARTINQLCQLAITHAIEQSDQILSSKHVQHAITHLPWLSSLPIK